MAEMNAYAAEGKKDAEPAGIERIEGKIDMGDVVYLRKDNGPLDDEGKADTGFTDGESSATLVRIQDEGDPDKKGDEIDIKA